MGTRLIRYLAINLVAGLATGWLVAASVIIADIGGIGSLIRASNSGLLGAGLFYFMFGLTFATLSMGLAVMALTDQDSLIPSGIRRFYQRLADNAALGDKDE